MPFLLSEWSKLADIFSTFTDFLSLGKASYDFYNIKRKNDSTRQAKAAVPQKAFSTYSDRELEVIRKRIENCRDKFINEGDGSQRNRCICSVSKDVQANNGFMISDEDKQVLRPTQLRLTDTNPLKSVNF